MQRSALRISIQKCFWKYLYSKGTFWVFLQKYTRAGLSEQCATRGCITEWGWNNLHSKHRSRKISESTWAQKGCNQSSFCINFWGKKTCMFLLLHDWSQQCCFLALTIYELNTKIMSISCGLSWHLSGTGLYLFGLLSYLFIYLDKFKEEASFLEFQINVFTVIPLL